jgi:hypothetical protein
MLYDEFQSWLISNKPSDIDDYEFLEFCALCGVLTIQNTLKTSDITISELMSRFFENQS